MKLCDRIRSRREELGMSQDELAKKLGYKSRSSINKIEMGINDVTQSKIVAFADALSVSPGYLMGWEGDAAPVKTVAPALTDDTVTFPVVGDVAAGYDHFASPDWSGDSVEIPRSYLKGRKPEEFMVLRVCGDSMYPLFFDNDKVLILRQTTLNRSGEIGAVLYDDDMITLKKVEYVMGEDWLELVPLNPNYKPQRIEGEDLEHCRVLGIPKLLIRDYE
ncbi:MAG: helix-turn-helix domain-containing protein [Clostridia bacterium]|nr:helix-turn-helix domain-containing protein [Clostridia bacterium]